MPEQDINILFLGGAKRVSLAEHFIAEGKKRNINVRIFSYELKQDVPIAFVAEIIIGLKWADAKVLDHLQQIITDKKIHVVLPFLDTATLIGSKLRALELKDVFIPVSEYRQCELFFNKADADEWCRANQVQAPTDLSAFPLIAKPVFGSASKGLVILNTEADYLPYKNRRDYLVQQFITGKEYSIDAYISPSTRQIISLVPRIRLEVQGGESITSVTVRDEAVIAFAETILRKAELEGPVTLQVLKEERTQKLFFMEINPRFGGAVVNSIEAGANSPSYILNDYLGVKNEAEHGWKDNLMMIRRYSEYYKYADNN